MTVMIATAIVATATISATLVALLLTHRSLKEITRTNLVKAHEEQLKDIEEKRQSGQIDETQADKARIRILRTLARKAAAPEPRQKTVALSCGALIAAVLVTSAIATVLITNSQFASTSPLQDVPVSADQRESSIAATASTDRADTAVSDLRAYLGRTRKLASPMASVQNKRPSVPSVETMIKRLAARLESAPDKAEDWRMLGWSYFRTERYREAAEAYARAVALRPGNASWQSEYGAALVKSSDDKVTDKAKSTFSQALKLDPSDRVGRFYTALTKTQDNDKKGALEDWIALLRDFPEIDSWSDDLKEQILALAKEIGEDVGDRLPGVQKTAVTAKAIVEGPSADDIRAARDLSPAARSEMIRGMVQRLASRLEKNPDDAEGWVRLIRSRMVLREPEKAHAALGRAIDIFSERPDVKQKILQEAKSLGVSPTTKPQP